MSALLRYQAAILLRSHRWIFPLIGYALLITVGAAGSSSLAESLDWSAAMLVPVVAFLTRAMLTAEPDAARACVAAATSPVRAQLATLLTALGAGTVLGLVSACFDVLTSETATTGQPPPGGMAAKLSAIGDHPGIVAGGLLTALVCLLVGSAVGALCNPPILRHPGAAMLTTLAAIILALATDISPAAAAVRLTSQGQASDPVAAFSPGASALAGAACLLIIAWAASLLAATHRDARTPSVT